MIYVITDNQFLYAGIELLLCTHEIAASRISVNHLSNHVICKDNVYFIERPLHEENVQFLSKLYRSGARFCFLLQHAIESVRNDDTQFIDITTRLNIFTYTVLKTISGSANLPAVNTVRLTDREFTVARLVLCGRSDEDIATVLSITKRSSQDHINRVLKKLGGKSVADIYLHRNVIYGSCSAR
ncbi:helix-turn-helix transcriptional regulator [Klebsiella sp. GG_Kp146]|uniref:helix-turn-helix domain-containing protein n=2 Tax=Klebsiella TaxID=570 RepID=UPI0032B573C5